MEAERAGDADGETPPRILVVEDEFLVRLSIASMLRDTGAVVAEAEDAEEAWRYLSGGFQADLVFTDNRMPGSMSGVQLAKKIRVEYPAIDVVIVSADWRDLEWDGTVVAKPYPLEDTAAELARRALDARRPG